MTAIIRRRGDTYADEVTVTDKDGAAIDVTGYSFLMTLDPSKTPADATNNLYQIVGTVIDGPTGRVEFAPTELQANMAQFPVVAPPAVQPPAVYWYDIQMVDGAGRKRTIALDKYTYTQDITK